MFGPSSVTSAVSSASISSASSDVSVDHMDTITMSTKIPNPTRIKLFMVLVYQMLVCDVVFLKA